VHTIDGEAINQAARAYSNPDGFISTWEGEPDNPSPLGVLVNYNDGIEGKTLRPAISGLDIYHGVADPLDVDRSMVQMEQICPDISAKYTGKALVSNWWQNPFSKGAFVSPGVHTMTVWCGALWVTEGAIFILPGKPVTKKSGRIWAARLDRENALRWKLCKVRQ